METDFSRRLRTRRLRLGWDQDRLAREAGLSASSISAWERGKNMPTGQNIEELARALAVSSSWLVGGGNSNTAIDTERERTRLALRRMSVAIDELSMQLRDLQGRYETGEVGPISVDNPLNFPTSESIVEETAAALLATDKNPAPVSRREAGEHGQGPAADDREPVQDHGQTRRTRSKTSLGS